MFHCHQLRHEDVAMMRAFVVTQPGLTTDSTILGADELGGVTPAQQFWTRNGKIYDNYKTPTREAATGAVQIGTRPGLVGTTYVQERLDERVYCIFSPLTCATGQDPINDPAQPCEEAQLFHPLINPWLVNPNTVCPIQDPYAVAASPVDSTP